MKLTVVADQGGKIVSITQFGDVGDKVSGITKAGVEAGKGHSVHESTCRGNSKKRRFSIFTRDISWTSKANNW